MDVVFFAQLRKIVICILPESQMIEISYCLQVIEVYSLLAT